MLKSIIFTVKKTYRNEVTFFWKECNKLYVICYLSLGVTVPLVTSIDGH